MLPETEKELPCKGLNFATPPRKMKFESCLSPFEILFQDVSENFHKLVVMIILQYEHLGKSIATGKPYRYSNKDQVSNKIKFSSIQFIKLFIKRFTEWQVGERFDTLFLF